MSNNQYRPVIKFATILCMGVLASLNAINTNQAGDIKNSSDESLPQEYRVLAETISIDLVSSKDKLTRKQNFNEAMYEVTAAGLALQGIHSEDSDINYIANLGKSAISDMSKAMKKIDTLPKSDATEILVQSIVVGGISAFFGLDPFVAIAAGLEIGSDASKKEQDLSNAFKSLFSTVDELDTIHMLLPKIAQKYAAPHTEDIGNIQVDIDESMTATETADLFTISNNTGQELTDCTIQVDLVGADGQSRKNIHFVRKWPVDTKLYAQYSVGIPFENRVVIKQSVIKIQKATVSIWSPKHSTTINYTYQGKEKKYDIANFCRKLSFTKVIQPFEKGYFFDTQPGLVATLDDLTYVPDWIRKCKIDVEFCDSENSKTWTWELDNWNKGEKKVFSVPSRDLDFTPTRINMFISFPDCDYIHMFD